MEIWKNVIGYEGLYQISNLGIVKRTGSFRGVNKKYLNGYSLIPIDNGKGYLRIKLTKNNKSKRVMLHRIIAEAFIEKFPVALETQFPINEYADPLQGDAVCIRAACNF
jgi:hypothetical protein